MAWLEKQEQDKERSKDPLIEVSVDRVEEISRAPK